MQKIDLLPCPFCGSPAKLCSAKANAAGTRFVFWVHCDFMGDLNCDVIPTTPKFDTAEQAVKAWNTRALGWISVEDTLPEIKEFHISDTVLCYCDSGALAIARLEENGFGQVGFNCEKDDDYHHAAGKVLYWMPLPEIPEPPKAK